jgi:parallel beta-helix repeat protein
MVKQFKIILLLVTLPFTVLGNIWGIEGFGAHMDIFYNQELVVNTEADFIAYSKFNNSLIRFAPALILHLTKIIAIANQSNMIILGPVTVTQFGIYVYNSSSIILRDIRILNASIYGILIYESDSVVIDHCTILDASRTDITSGKCIDLTEGSSNVTISYNILGYTYPIQELNKFKGLLIANFKQGPVSRVSLHHNLFYCNYKRSPEISTDGLFDMRENIIFNFTEYGSRIRNSAHGNFVSNSYIGGKKDPLVFNEDVGGVYAKGNSWLYNGAESRTIDDFISHSEFSAPAITSKSQKETLALVGCLQRQRWETSVSG